MEPEMFLGVDAEDEIWLNRLIDQEKPAQRMKEHRDTYITYPDSTQRQRRDRQGGECQTGAVPAGSGL